MKVTTTELPGVLLLEPKLFGDERGFFFESFNQRVFDETVGARVNFVQDNHSRSMRGVLRGLHYQVAPHAQGKLVRVARGSAFDVAVDLRRGSPSFGRWAGVVLEDDTHFLYKTTDYYAKDCERAVAWNDASLGIEWPLAPGEMPLLAAKDGQAPRLDDAEVFT
jgi:dTDP-4-dehydrorhamnose 3,5-epimerase